MSVTLFCKGQEAYTLTFNTNDTNIGKLDKDKLDAFLNNRPIETVTILAKNATWGNASKARINLSNIVEELTAFLLEVKVPANLISAMLIGNENDTISTNQIVINCNFGTINNEGILKKTPIVEISEVKLNKPNIQIRDVATNGKEKKDIINEPLQLLDKKAFKKNETIELPNLLFEPGKHLLLPGSEKVLDELLMVMNDNPKLRIELQGHICCRLGGADGPDPSTGLENLSEMRAKIVYLYLSDKGISTSRMSYKGFGSSRKLFQDESNSYAQMRNRRVEVLVIDTK